MKVMKTWRLFKDKDGNAFVRCGPNGVYLKVTPPVGKGKKVYTASAVHELQSRNIENYDNGLVEKLVDEAGGMYVKVAEFNHNPANDTMANIEVDDAEMKVIATIIPPNEGGADLTVDVYKSLLVQNRVYHGVKEQ